MFAHNGTTLFVLDQVRTLSDQCGKLYFYEPLVVKHESREAAAFKARYLLGFQGTTGNEKELDHMQVFLRLVPYVTDIQAEPDSVGTTT